MHESEKWKGSRSVVSDSSQPHGLQPTRLLRPWDFPGKSTGVGCHRFLLFVIDVLLYILEYKQPEFGRDFRGTSLVIEMAILPFQGLPAGPLVTFSWNVLKKRLCPLSACFLTCSVLCISFLWMFLLESLEWVPVPTRLVTFSPRDPLEKPSWPLSSDSFLWT